MKLSKRLETLISLVPRGSLAADIGTDHALVPISLAEEGICPEVIAADIRKGPLEGARKNVESRCLGEKIKLRLGDGLKVLRPGEAGVLIVSGVGGALLKKILTEGEDVAQSADRLILSPQSELPAFRRFLSESGYCIEKERLIREEGKYYFILAVKPGKKQYLSEEEIFFGKNIAEEDQETWREYLEETVKKQRGILKQLAGAPGRGSQREGEVVRLMDMAGGLLARGAEKEAKRKERNEMSSKLGFGLMRLPRLADGSVDLKQSAEMVDHFLENGGTYFDTAFVYEGSEEAAKKILVDRHPRESYTLATKMNTMVQPRTEESTKQQFYTSLERTGAGYFDYYLLHALSKGNAPLHREFDTWRFIADRKAEGLIRHCGFSFHDSPQMLDELLKEHPEVDFVQLQINYADWDNPDVQSRGIYEVARKHNKQIVVMEPVKGGTLASLPQAAEKVLKELAPEASLASWAIRYVASLEGILSVLSGMSTLDQVRDNMSYMGQGRFQPLSEREKKAIEEVRTILASQRQIGCTACKYCVEGCPTEIDIPGIFSAYNMFLRFENKEAAIRRYQMRIRDKGKAGDCISCGACEDACPQHLPIRELLKEISTVFE